MRSSRIWTCVRRKRLSHFQLQLCKRLLNHPDDVHVLNRSALHEPSRQQGSLKTDLAKAIVIEKEGLLWIFQSPLPFPFAFSFNFFLSAFPLEIQVGILYFWKWRMIDGCKMSTVGGEITPALFTFCWTGTEQPKPPPWTWGFPHTSIPAFTFNEAQAFPKPNHSINRLPAPSPSHIFQEGCSPVHTDPLNIAVHTNNFVWDCSPSADSAFLTISRNFFCLIWERKGESFNPTSREAQSVPK